jgi:phage baseplate assembly protein W
MSVTPGSQVQLGTRGAWLVGVEATEQEIRTLCGTHVGAVPLDPQLGIDWLSIIDLPSADAVPALMREVHRVLARYLPLVTVVSVEVVSAAESCAAKVTWRPSSESGERTVEVGP